MDDGPSSIPIGSFLFVLALLACSAYLSATEMAVASLNRIRIESLAGDGSRRAKRVLRVLDRYDRAVVTLLIASNLVSIACASLVTVLVARLWGQGAVAAATVVTTAVIFLFSEMLPKSYAKARAEQVAMQLAPSLLFLMRLFSPVTHILSAWTNLLQRRNKNVAEGVPTVTQDELTDLIETAVREGALDDDTTELVEAALEFTKTTARGVMTPWEQVFALPAGLSPTQVVERIRQSSHSRLPILDAEGKVIGVLQIRKYLRNYIQREGHVSLRRVADNVFFTQADEPIDALLPAMSAQKTHMAIVRDAAGRQLGIVTVEDIIEELLGEIYDEKDSDMEGVRA